MKLTEYVTQFCNALRMPNPEGKVITLNLGVEHKHHRDVVAAALEGLFLSGNGFLLDGLFNEKQHILNAYQAEVKRGAERAAQEDVMRMAKPKRKIQEAPNKGKIAKKQIEGAVKAAKSDGKEI